MRQAAIEFYISSNVILRESRSRTKSRGKRKISRQQPHLAAKSLFSLQNVCDSSTAHTAVKVMRRRTQRALARKEQLRKTPGASKGERTKQLRAQQHDSAFMMRTQRQAQLSSKLQQKGVHRHQGAVTGFPAHSCTPQTERRLSQGRS